MSHLTFDNLNEHFKLNILCKIFVLLCFCSYTLQAKTTIELLDGKILLSEAKLTYKHARLKITTKTQIWEITAAQIDYYFDKHQMLIQDHASMKSDDIEITAEKILLHTDTGLVEIEKGTILIEKIKFKSQQNVNNVFYLIEKIKFKSQQNKFYKKKKMSTK